MNIRNTQGRDVLFDTYKYVLILLVIAGHIMEGYRHLYGWMEYVFSFVYLFHMPCFAFISGFFSKRVVPGKMVRQSLRLGETFILLQIGFLWLKYREMPDVDEVFAPWYAPWYLLALIWWRWIGYFCLRYCRRGLWAVGVAFCLSLLSGFVEVGSYFALGRTCMFLPFFIAGLYTRPAHIEAIRRLPVWPFGMVVLCVALLLEGVVGNEFNGMEYGTGFHFGEESFTSSMQRLWERLFIFVSASLLTVCFLRLCPRWNYVAKYGARTLFFFAFHVFFIIFQLRLRGWLGVSHPGWWYPLTVFLLTVACLNVLSRYRVFYYLLNPVSSLTGWWRKKKGTT